MKPNPIELSVEELQSIRTSDTPHRLIDCREDDEWHCCRIEGATLMPLSRFEDFANGLPADKQTNVIVYCHHGVRSLRATQHLRRQGYDNAQSLRGGIDLWSELVDPSVPRY